MVLVASCGDNATPPVPIGGTVDGLEGSGLVLRNRGGDELAVYGDGEFVFASPVEVGGDYEVTVASQPTEPTQTCVVTNGTGAVVDGAPITDIRVTCMTGAFPVGGTVSGLRGAGLVLQNNGTDELAITADGTFTFAMPIASGAAFAVTVASQPSEPTQTCTVAGGKGTVGAGAVATVVVDCATDRFTVGGLVSGLAGTVVLQNNGGDDITISSNGSFAFPSTIASGDSYEVTVATHPDAPSQTCTVSSGAGTVTDADITSVRVECATNTFSIGGTVTGLAGSGLVLQNNGGDNLAITEDGTFTFSTPIASGETYAVSVLAQPSDPTQSCTVTSEAGTVSDANITNVSVSCVTRSFAVGGRVIGLAGSGLVLQNNAGDDLAIAADGTFSFATPVASGESYEVTVLAQPSGPAQTCAVSGGTGIIGAGPVASVVVNCTTNTYVIGGTIAGLAGTLVLRNNDGDDLTVTANGTFAFATPVESGEPYSVTVHAQPGSPSQTCTVASGSGTVVAADVTTVEITCVTNRFAVRGTVSGLAGSGLVLENSGGDELAITANGSFAFATPVESGAAYEVTVGSQPTGPSQTCVVSSASGVIGGADVTDVTVTCTTNTYRVGGVVTGLVGAGLVLQNHGGDDLVVDANGTFHFDTLVASGESYAVTVGAHPTAPWQTCVVTDGSGPVTSADIASVVVTCTTNTYRVGGTVSGLAGTGLRIQNHGGDELAISADGDFTFATPVASGGTFEVTVLAQPEDPAQTCTVTGGSGTIGGGDVTSVTVNCATNRYAVGGTVSGLVGSGLVLQNHGGDELEVTSNGSFAFPTPVASGETYAISVLVQPGEPAQTCTVTAGTGTVTNAAITDVAVTCTTNRYAIHGTLVGLAPGGQVVVRNNGADEQSLATNGVFSFSITVPSGQPYEVTVVSSPTAPISQTCTVSSGSGTVGSADVADVVVTCTTNTFTIGGTVSGLADGALVLHVNGGDARTITGNGPFTFATPIASGETFSVTVATHPEGQRCTVESGTGTVGDQDITTVAVTCVDAITKWSEGTYAWPDQACNPLFSFGGCNTNDQDHADAWATQVCRNNGYSSGVWTGRKEPGCSGQISMYCGGQIPCFEIYEASCFENDQTRVEIACFP